MAVGGDRIRQHIVTVARRDPSDYAVLADALHSVTWPDGGRDRSHADAQGWFDRFMSLRGPAPELVTRSCNCASGRCLVCN
jgi:hypothetical protein